MKKAMLVSLVFSTLSLFANSEKFPEISLKDLEIAVEAKTVTLLDANGVKRYKKGHIPTAISFTKNKESLASHLPKDKGALIVAYCGGPLCGAWEEAADKAHELGYTNIKHFTGGIKVWEENKKPVDKNPA